MSCQSTNRVLGVLWVTIFCLAVGMTAGCRRRSNEARVVYFVAYAMLDGTEQSRRVDMTADLSNPFSVPLRKAKLKIQFVDGTTELLDFGDLPPREEGGQYRAFPAKGAVSESIFLGGAAEAYISDGEMRFVFCNHIEKATLTYLLEKAPREMDVTRQINELLPESFKQTSEYIEKENLRRRQALEGTGAKSTKDER